MLSCLRGDSFSNQLGWTGTHLYSSSRVAGKQSARYFQFGLAKHFLLCCESGLEAFFDEREARPQPEPVSWNKQWRELLTKRLECWRPNASLTSPSLSFRELVFKTKRMLNLKQLELDFCNSWVSYLQWLCLSVDVYRITTSLITFNSQKPDFRFRWTFPRFLPAVNQSLDVEVEESYSYQENL